MAPKRLTPRGEAAPAPKATPARKAAKKKTAAAAPKTTRATTLFVRNLNGIDARATLDNGRRIELKSRGQRGDLAPVSKEDQNDAKFHANTGLVWEVITKAVADEVIAKQSTNQQSFPAQPQTVLTNALGEPITSIVVDKSEAERSITVAQIEQQPGGRFVEHQESLIRENFGPAEAPVPGSVQNPGPMPEADDPFGGLSVGRVDPTRKS